MTKSGSLPGLLKGEPLQGESSWRGTLAGHADNILKMVLIKTIDREHPAIHKESMLAFAVIQNFHAACLR
jgi:hypothetical protein